MKPLLRFHFLNRIASDSLVTNRVVAIAGFSIITLLIFMNVGIFRHIGDKPNSVHTWAQCDRASVAACYYNENMNFFKPRIYNRSDGSNSGICGMEFPIINYTAAIFYKLFGFHEFYYRLINFSILFIGLVAAFLLAKLFIKDLFFSASAVWLFMLSPVLMFYSANFLPDTASLGLVMMALYLFFRIAEENSGKKFIIFILIITIASLIKPTSMVSVIAMICLLVAKRIRLIKSDLIPGLNLKMVLGLVFCFVCVISWYQYAAWLNDKYHNYFFILKSNPVQTRLEFRQVLNHIYVKQFKDYYPLLMKYIIAVSFVVFLISFYFKNRVPAFICALLIVGFSGFAFAMFRQFEFHDYYIIPLLPVIFFLLVTGLELIKNKLTVKPVVYIPAVAGLLILTNMCMIVCKKFYTTERYGAGYNGISYSEFDRYWQARPFLDSLGVKKNDLVISYYDGTPNASLYLMDRKGTTIDYGDITGLKNRIATNNFDYLVLNDTARFTKELFESLQEKRIGAEHGLQVYKLKK